jgi:phosphoribosyl 1,2-cyclic phosphate phosphodiesterase
MPPSLTITFLGTGTSSGVPMIACGCDVCTSKDHKDKRLRSSIFVQSPDTNLVVDTTPDFRYQMLRENIKKLDAVLFTHPHKDHIAGLDDIRPFNYFQEKPMPIYANQMTEEAIRRDFHYAFSNTKYPGTPDIVTNTIDEGSFEISGINIQPILVWHLKMPVYGYRFNDFTYITDANRIDDEEKEKIKGSKVLVLNALRNEKHISHFNLDEAIELSLELEAEEVYFTHISHQLGTHEKVSSKLPKHIHLAFDGLKIIV